MLAHVSVNLFDYGKISIVFEIPVRQGTPSTSCGRSAEVYGHRAHGDGAGGVRHVHRAPQDRAAPPRRGRSRPIEPVPTRSRMRSFTIIFIEDEPSARQGHPRVAGPPQARDRRVVRAPPGDKQVRDTMQNTDSYLDNDLVVIDWNSAFVLEPSSTRDIPSILEFARSMLLQLRVYDDQLDVELRQIYQEFLQAPGRHRLHLQPALLKLAHDVSARLVGVTEFNERIENSFKIIGDYYLRASTARPSRASASRSCAGVFRHSLVGKVYDMLKGEVELLRGQALELTIVILIVVELILGLMKVVQ